MKIKVLLLILLLLPSLVTAATLKGSIYNSNLELEPKVLVQLNTVPLQQLLSPDGTYSFSVAPGTYNLTAIKNDVYVQETITIKTEGEFVYDLFLLPGLLEEDELWSETDQELEIDDPEESRVWAYVVAGLIFAYAIYRIVRARLKYGSLWKFRKYHQAEAKKTIEQHKEDLAAQPGYLEEALAIIRKHDGRISQRDLRREMLHLSEAKVSLIVTELEHKGRIEKVKKGRGNVILLK